jgi:hypothetical protein
MSVTASMLRSSSAALALCVCAASASAFGAGSQARKARPAPRFEDYPVREVYKGPVARVRLESRRARMFRTVLREDSRGGPNFAGHYAVVFWGCGTGCAQMGVVDSKTGRVYFPPVEYMDFPDTEDAEVRARFFRPDSKLLVITQNHYDTERTYTAYYFLFDDNRFRLLRKAEERMPQTPGDEN